MNKTQKRERLKKLKAEIIPEFGREIGRITREVSQKQKELAELQRVLDKHEQEAVDITISLTPKTPAVPQVSDHALVRYLERHHGFDLDKFRAEILTEERKQAISQGATKIKANGLQFKVENNVVVTVI